MNIAYDKKELLIESLGRIAQPSEKHPLMQNAEAWTDALCDLGWFVWTYNDSDRLIRMRHPVHHTEIRLTVNSIDSVEAEHIEKPYTKQEYAKFMSFDLKEFVRHISYTKLEMSNV